MSSPLTLQTIFADDITRKIEGVIKADDDRYLADEVREYVITKEVGQKLTRQFFDVYNDPAGGTNGVWISGFFGSGKSHLLKMLSLLLENREVAGMHVSDQFAKKAEGDAILSGQIKVAARIPSQSILFNIDSKADVTRRENDDAVLAVFMSVFNQMQGYDRVTGWLAELERDMHVNGVYGKFKAKYQELHGISWEDGRKALKAGKRKFAAAYAAVTGESDAAARELLGQARQDYHLSIEIFAERVAAYIVQQPTGFRLNFFVDEVGQYIGDNTKLMTNLQTIAENLFTQCSGQAWVFVTSQEEISDVVKGMKERHGQDFSKIQARFGCKFNLSSQNVDEVIELRLLQKNEPGTQVLKSLYKSQHENFKTLLSFDDGGVAYPVAKSEADFIKKYPFQPYHFGLVQECIRALSRNNALSGKHASVGERSLLSVFQDVVKEMIKQGVGVGELPSFDRMFDGVQPILKGEVQASLNSAINTIGKDSFEVKVLKVLFLVRYVNGFTPTAKHIANLLVDDFAIDARAHAERVKTALNTLVRNTYVLRNADRYEYLTDEEKDIANEIKNTPVDRATVGNSLASLIFDHVIGGKNRDVVYKGNGQRFRYSRMIDDVLVGRKQDELTLHIITDRNDAYTEDLNFIKQHSSGKPELRLVLPSDSQLFEDIELYEQTNTYLRQNNGNFAGDKKMILIARGEDNTKRYAIIAERIKELLRTGTLIIDASEVKNVGNPEINTRIALGMQELIEIIYHKLRDLPKDFNQDDIRTALAQRQTELTDTQGPAETELINHVNLQTTANQRVTPRSLVQHFGSRPYGWSETSTLTILARLLAANKVEGRANGELKSARQSTDYLTNSSKYDQLIVSPLAEISARDIKKLKDLHRQLFNAANGKRDGKEVALEFQESLKELRHRVEKLVAKSGSYPFVTQLEPLAGQLQRYERLPYADYYGQVTAMEDDLLEAYEDYHRPISEFMAGSQLAIYDELTDFLRRGRDNLQHIEQELVKPLRAAADHPTPYRQQVMATAKVDLDKAKEAIRDRLARDHRQAALIIEGKHQQLLKMEEYADLTEQQRLYVTQTVEHTQYELKRQHSVSSIAYGIGDFTDRTFAELINAIARYSDQHRNPPPPVKQYGTTPKPVDNQPAEPKKRYERIPTPSQIAQELNLVYLKEEAEVERFLDKYREVLLGIIGGGNGVHF